MSIYCRISQRLLLAEGRERERALRIKPLARGQPLGLELLEKGVAEMARSEAGSTEPKFLLQSLKAWQAREKWVSTSNIVEYLFSVDYIILAVFITWCYCFTRFVILNELNCWIEKTDIFTIFSFLIWWLLSAKMNSKIGDWNILQNCIMSLVLFYYRCKLINWVL